jgi:hypothetical protein
MVVEKRKDLEWGGRVRRPMQFYVERIAKDACAVTSRRLVGNMISSADGVMWSFLDGGVSVRRGFFDSTCGMFIHGDDVRSFILWKLGADPNRILKTKNLKSLETLEVELRGQA